MGKCKISRAEAKEGMTGENLSFFFSPTCIPER